MLVKLIRVVNFDSYETGSVLRTTEKIYEGVAPILGAVVLDPAWSHDEGVKVESITIDTENPNIYEVDLTTKKASSKDKVFEYVEYASKYNWDVWEKKIS